METAEQGTPKVVITVEPVPLAMLMDDDWYTKALKLKRLHAAAPALADALTRMILLHSNMMKEINHAKSFYSADTISEMNAAPIAAQRALHEALGK